MSEGTSDGMSLGTSIQMIQKDVVSEEKHGS
jgi:hypothetical protein